VGRPWQLYLKPANRFVADFIGTMNVFPARVEGQAEGGGRLAVTTDFGERWQIPGLGRPGEDLLIGVRPESLQLEPGQNPAEGWNVLKGTIVEVIFLGALIRYQVRVTETLAITADIHNPDFGAIASVGDRVTLWFAASRALPLPGEARGN
jgi:ABC-type Fe3+/spermidine/putrescine transport system ATPase subunit